MFVFVTVLIIVVAVLLAIVVLVQNSKGGGLAANFASQNQVMGVRKTADFLEKATWTLAAVLIGLCILVTAFISSDKADKTDDIQERMEQTMPVEGQPEFPVLPQGNTETPAN